MFEITKNFLDKTGMYRVVSLALIFLVVCSVSLSFVGQLAYSPADLSLSLFLALLFSVVLNALLGHWLSLEVNHESAFITGLLMFFLIIPGETLNLSDQKFIILASALAILSKYLFVYKKQHIANPVAVGAAALGLYYLFVPSESFFEALWWIGTPVLFLPLLIAGSLVVFKIRKWPMVTSFLMTSFVAYLFEGWRFGSDLLTDVSFFWLSGPSLFLAFFMLTEPFTTPPTKNLQVAYGALVGVVSQLLVFSTVVPMTPELALVIGNIVFWPTRLRQRLFLKLKAKAEVAKYTYEFIFERPKNFRFKAGQYLEWMLPHKNNDSRGTRRYFTIASSPTESDLRLALRVPNNASSYKRALQTMVIGDQLIASQLSGDFLLPKDNQQKLAFVAGGIGVTPFISHIKYMMDSSETYDTILFYCNNTKQEVAYIDLFESAHNKFKLQTVNVIANEPTTPPDESGFMSEDIIKRRAEDYLERLWYLSGPPVMVNAVSKTLLKIGVTSKNIIKDFFPGLS